MSRKGKNPVRAWQGFLLVVFGLALGLLLLEGGMRLAGFVILRLQEWENREALRAGGEVAILCLGESTTAGGYPAFLAEELNRRLGAARFAVINGGISGTDTTAILQRLDDNLEKYDPDIVVVMMGINDPEAGVLHRRLRPDGDESFWSSLRVYKLGVALVRHVRAWREGTSRDLEELYGARELPSPSPPAPSPGKAEWPRDRARRLLRAKRYEEAAASWEKVLERHPEDLPAARRLAESWRKSGREGRALELARGLYRDRPEHGGVALEYARCLDAAGFPDAAATVFAAAVRLRPADPAPCFDLARLLERREDVEEILAAAWEGLRRSLPAAQAYCADLVARSEAALIEGDFAEVEHCCLLVLDLFPHHSLALRNYVDLRRRQDRQLEAIAYCRELLTECPQDVHLRAHLGSLLADLERYDEAEQVLKEAIDISLKNSRKEVLVNYGPVGFARLVNLYLSRGEFSRVRELCLEILETVPDSPRVLRVLASACGSLGEEDRAGEYRGLAAALEAGRGNPVTEENYRCLIRNLRLRGIRPVAVQYPCRPLSELRAGLAGTDEGVIFVDNENCFREGIAREGVTAYFTDLFAGDFGHMTPKGKRLLAANIAAAILAPPPLSSR